MQDPARSRHPAPTHPSQGRDRPRDWLTERHWWCWPRTSQDQKQHTHPTSRREWSEATHHLTLAELSPSEKQGMVWRTPLIIPCVVSLAAASAAQTADRLSRGN